MKYHFRGLFCLITGFIFITSLVRAQTESVTNAINQLGIDICEKLLEDDMNQNIIFSPFGIQKTLAMAYIGATDSTREEMQKVLYYSQNETRFFEELKELSLLISIDTQSHPSNFQLINALIFSNKFNLNPDFKSEFQKYFKVAPQRVDLRQPEIARRQINMWVSKETNYCINNLIPDNKIDTKDRLILVNATYFNMPWATKFNKKETEDAIFYTASDTTTSVQMMHLENILGYKETEDYQIASLPYKGNIFQFLLILPKERDIRKQKAPSIELLMSCKSIPDDMIILFLPRFKITTANISLKTVLQSLGMKEAFSDEAKFTQMLDQSNPLKIEDIFNESSIHVFEEGTTIFSSLFVRARVVSSIKPIVQANRPFYFAVQHIKTGICIFIGKVNDPSK